MGCCSDDGRIGINSKKLEGLKLDKNFALKALKKINEYREIHGVEKLELDSFIMKKASIFAKQKAKTLDNEDKLYKIQEPLGINLKISEKELKAEELIEEWYGDKKYYNFHAPDEYREQKDVGNFTQLIWKNSKKFGIGYFCSNENSKDPNEQKNYYYVAFFYPQGNIPKEYEKNVLRPKNDLRIKKEKDKNKKKIQREIDENINHLNPKEIGDDTHLKIQREIESISDNRSQMKRENQENYFEDINTNRHKSNNIFSFGYKKRNDYTEDYSIKINKK